MGLDGFSMSNLGLNRNLTSAQLANEAEDTARQSLENQIADVDGVGKKEKVGKKDEDAAFNGTIPFIGEPKEKEDEEQQSVPQEEENAQSQSNMSQSEEDDDADKYHFRFNEAGQIEVWDAEAQELVRTISPEQAAKVFSSFTKVPGILINRQI